MNNNNESSSLVRLLMGLMASVGIGIIVAQQVDIISTPLSIMVGILATITGVVSTKILTAVAPRREKPTKLGSLAMILFLAAYVVLGKMLWPVASIAAYLAFVAAGGVFIWLVFSAVAETALLYATGFGGFCCGFVGVVIVASYSAPFHDLLGRISTPAEMTTIYGSIGLICAFAGAFAAITGRLSGYGLAENRTLQTWAFNEKGQLFIRRD